MELAQRQTRTTKARTTQLKSNKSRENNRRDTANAMRKIAENNVLDITLIRCQKQSKRGSRDSRWDSEREESSSSESDATQVREVGAIWESSERDMTQTRDRKSEAWQARRKEACLGEPRGSQEAWESIKVYTHYMLSPWFFKKFINKINKLIPFERFYSPLKPAIGSKTKRF